VTISHLLTLGPDPWPVQRDLTPDGCVTVKLNDEAEGVEIWNPSWTNASEDTLQMSLRAIATLLNADWHSGKLYWDFDSERRPTLGNLKPDGHGRLKRDEVYFNSLPHLAVLLEVKIKGKCSEGISQFSFFGNHDLALTVALGQALMYCHRLLAFDTTREHVFALVTDLQTCWLIQVQGTFVDEVAHHAVERNTVRMAQVPWYDQDANEFPGLQVLTSLSTMAWGTLGLPPMHVFREPVELLRTLGHGSNANVYAIKSRDRNGDVVLKVAKPSGRADIANERMALTALNKPQPVAQEAAAAVASRSGPRLRSARAKAIPSLALPSACVHFPELLPNVDLALDHLRAKPIGRHLHSGNIKPHIIYELVDTIEWLHGRGWLHGDISPNNLMLAAHGWRTATNHVSVAAPGQLSR
jgi:hypothetical protein